MAHIYMAVKQRLDLEKMTAIFEMSTNMFICKKAYILNIIYTNLECYHKNTQHNSSLDGFCPV